MKFLKNKFAVCTYSREGNVVLTPRDLYLYSCDSGLREFLEQSAIRLDKCAKDTKTNSMKTILKNNHKFSFMIVIFTVKFLFSFIKSHFNTLISIVALITFILLMIP